MYHFKKANNNLSSLFENMQLSDYILVTNDKKEIKCHKAIISFIPYFNSLFSNNYSDFVFLS